MEQPEGGLSQSLNGNGIHAVASKAEERVRVLGDQAGERAHKYGSMAQQRIDAERARVADRFDEAAAKLRERGDSMGSVGHEAGEKVANRLESAAGYLHEHQAEDIAGDLATYMKKHPVRTAVAAAVLGYLIGRMAA